MVPIALVLPSVKSTFVPGCRNSGRYMNSNVTRARTPVEGGAGGELWRAVARARRHVRGASHRTGAQHLLVHRADADALAHVASVQDRLVVHPHRRLRVEHEDVAREDSCRCRGGRRVEEDHPLPDAELADVLLGARAHDERAGLPGEQRGDRTAHVVDALDRHLENVGDAGCEIWGRGAAEVGRRTLLGAVPSSWPCGSFQSAELIGRRARSRASSSAIFARM